MFRISHLGYGDATNRFRVKEEKQIWDGEDEFHFGHARLCLSGLQGLHQDV